ncbi:ATP-binding protein [Flavonifractor sp. An112]|uniref:ATP-binding protein n=1 Tax=Flavonifractor sp. An112 TaxID=1965544 RepID=UPI00174C462A|nr:AAA family ATPase [Flavonifractor sp. An112]HIZ94118.1 AAA family ATPase [Candidatus Flavonifractor avicola]
MKIIRMKATFGGLDHRELELKEGLNIIEAPNEGGKSTWSAFLRAMLYGINTKERDKQGYIAEKNRYQPWNGGAMEGVVELEWKGEQITLRRGPKGNTPFGKFEAVYTDTGEPVGFLTADNVGETLIGAPREVFERSAFVGQGGAAIDGAPALEARIAALASSGEEDVSYSRVERRLRDWLNRRKHNKTGLIPKLEEELTQNDEIAGRQAKAFRLAQEARREMDKLQTEHKRLQAERDAHLARAMAARRQRWEEAQSALEAARGQVDTIEAELNRYGTPPDKATLQKAQGELNQLNALHTSRKQAEERLEQAQTQEAEAAAAAVDPLFPDMTPDQAWEQASEDAQAAGEVPRCGGLYAGGAVALALAAGSLVLAFTGVLPALWMGGAACGVLAVAGVGLFVSAALRKKKAGALAAELLERYEAEDPQGILNRASAYREACVVAGQAAKQREEAQQALDALLAQDENTRKALLELVHPFAPTVKDTFGVSAAISRALQLEERLATAQVKLEGAEKLAASLPRPEPVAADPGVEPRFDPAGTAARLNAAEGELSRLRSGLAMAQGELNTLGDPAELELRQEEAREELERRQTEYAALETALKALDAAHAGLQARFSPALNHLAGDYLAKLTGGKYDKVSLTRQFEALAEEAGGLQPRRALALSQGTADQLYLAVRLAACKLVLPQEEPCPLVLDDALANFDDSRAALALECLEELGGERQILLFTCHSRERAWQEGR